MRAFPILVYGSVDDDPRPDLRRWSVGTTAFRQQMSYLRLEGWLTLPVYELLSQLRHGDDLPQRSIAVTFDNGFEDVLTAALPEMEGMRATVYPTTGYLREGSASTLPAPGRMLERRQLLQLRQAGFEVGVNGHSHVALDTMRRHNAEADIATGKSVVEQALGEEVASFAYPYGHYDFAVQQMVSRIGFGNAVALKGAWTHERDDRWAIARIRIPRAMALQEFDDLLSRPSPAVVPKRDRLAVVGSRTARRARRMVEVGRG